MNVALWPLSMNVVSAKAASPSGAGSATGASSTRVGRARSSARTAMATSFVAPRPPGGHRPTRELGASSGKSVPDIYVAPTDTRNAAFATCNPSGLEIVRVLRQRLRPVVGDEHDVF